ncbi:MAG: hypothetical protein AAF648_16665 [Pseudomonadota bacterium]
MTTAASTDRASTESVDTTVDAQALTLLLRSPALSLSQVLELLDLGDHEFRRLVAEHPPIQHLLELRSRGELERRVEPERRCPTCGERFQPYGGARYCSDTCARAAAIRGRSSGRERPPERLLDKVETKSRR